MRQRTPPKGLPRQLALLAFGCAAAACTLTSEPSLPVGAARFEPPAPYTYWWDMVRECSGRTGDLTSVSWYYVPKTHMLFTDGRWVDGYWTKGNNRIVLSQSAMLSGQIVRHEMLHALTRGGHNRAYFAEKCGGVVACTGDCADDVGTPDEPADDAPQLPVRHLRAAMRLWPEVPDYARDSGWTSVEVSVSNDFAYDAWVGLDSLYRTVNALVLFGYELRVGDACQFLVGDMYTWMWKNQRFGIPAHTTRRMVFDQRLQPDNYCVRGYFNADTLSATFSITE